MPTDAGDVTLAQLAAMRAGAQTAEQRVFILTDNVSHGIGKLLCEKAAGVRAEVTRFRPSVTFYRLSAEPTAYLETAVNGKRVGVFAKCTVSIDGQVIMRDGRFDPEVLGLPALRG